jgi:hypothetical protein
MKSLFGNFLLNQITSGSLAKFKSRIESKPQLLQDHIDGESLVQLTIFYNRPLFLQYLISKGTGTYA